MKILCHENLELYGSGYSVIWSIWVSIYLYLSGLFVIQTLPVCKVGLRHSFLQPSDFLEAIMIQHHEPKAAMLHGVSVLELCLVIAMKHISEISDGEPFNFEMVYNGKMTVRI